MMITAPRLSLTPTRIGLHGRAWLMDLAAMRAHYGKVGAEVRGWIVEAAWAHPMWHSYMVMAVHLRQAEGFPPAVIHLPGATHEVMVYALDPQHTATVDRTPRFLLPANFHGQWIAASDDEAGAKVDACVDEILDGTLSPDTDFRRDWIARFSASNMKGPDIPPGLVGVGVDGSVVIVGTGKQNADTLLNVAAGPVPPKDSQH